MPTLVTGLLARSAYDVVDARRGEVALGEAACARRVLRRLPLLSVVEGSGGVSDGDLLWEGTVGDLHINEASSGQPSHQASPVISVSLHH